MHSTRIDAVMIVAALVLTTSAGCEQLPGVPMPSLGSGSGSDSGSGDPSVCPPACLDGGFDTGGGGGSTSGGADSSDGGASDDESSETGGSGSETGTGTESGSEESSGTGDEQDPAEVCFPGANEAGATCYPLVEIDPYDYPAPIGPNYGEPVRYLDVLVHDLSASLAPNFLFTEVSDPVAGQFQVIQPHAIEMLQEVRDMTGPLIVTSGYRSPPYNAGLPGAVTNSRHIYGDAFDLVPLDVSVQALADACEALDAGYVAIYEDGHVHCDWRDIPNNPQFYGDTASVLEHDQGSRDSMVAEIVPTGSWLRVEVLREHDEEGALSRRWTAYAADGFVLTETWGLEFQPPAGTARVEVSVGGRRTLSYGRPAGDRG